MSDYEQQMSLEPNNDVNNNNFLHNSIPTVG